MFGKVAKMLFGSRNDRLLRQYRKIVEAVNRYESEYERFSDEQLKAKTNELSARAIEGEALETLMPEAFATVREASRRVLGMRHFDVQLIGAMVLNDGKIAEMRTGEGKTLMATLAVYLNALERRGVHVITVNDYLARRDAEWMGRLYRFLGLSVGVIVNGLNHEERQQAYRADITYGTNNEFGFDYLRDNMAFSLESRVQRGLNFAIVDEVDSILIDEARTPLIISGPTNETSELYIAVNKVVPRLTRQESEDGPGDYSVDEKAKQAYLTEEGNDHVEQLLIEDGLLKEGESLYDPAYLTLLHHLGAALRAHALFNRDVEYIVRNREVIIVDEFTGRTMPGRRWSDGLHQAIEAKEGVTIQPENHTLASITFQNYFRLYKKLSGMTGTADTEAYEFQQIYNLEVVVIPTHRPMVRQDFNDLIYLNKQGKFNAIIADIKHCVGHGQPVLVGTTSIETSEHLSDILKKEKIEHQVLNAKQHEREAQVVAQAGRPGAVTIATNMAGRGTDIVLGGSLDSDLAALGEDPSAAAHDEVRANWQRQHDTVVASGGLHIIGTERHESRRIDNQLRGRSGRQGDPGSTRFYLSLEDNLMRIFASDRMRSLMQKFGMQEDEAIENSLVTRSIENAQRKVEAYNFDIRKNLLEYDDVANDQRKVVYQQRDELLSAEDIAETIKDIRADVVSSTCATFIPPGSMEEQWNVSGLQQTLIDEFGLDLPIQQWLDEDHSLHEETLVQRVVTAAQEVAEGKDALFGPELMRRVEKDLMLQVLDNHWKEHLAAMDYLRQGIGLRGYAAKNPKQEYKREAFEMFEALLGRIKHDVVGYLLRMQPTSVETLPQRPVEEPAQVKMQYQHPEAESPLVGAEPGTGAGELPPEEPFRREGDKVGRNDPCPCGSGKKYKHCHGKLV
ncbi:MAG: preprotein translocase subunit SecA [Thiotrichales bacterium]